MRTRDEDVQRVLEEANILLEDEEECDTVRQEELEGGQRLEEETGEEGDGEV